MNKKQKIPIALLTVENIKRGKLADAVPEFDELKAVVEHNDWHNHEPVFEHSLSVARHIKKIMRHAGVRIRKYLNQKIDRRRRSELLYIAALLHDIAKKETIVYRDGKTMCPGHEKLGGTKARNILKRFDLTLKDTAFVVDVVRYHGIGHRIAMQHLKNSEAISELPRILRRIAVELTLLAYADTVGSYLKKIRPGEFRIRICSHRAALEKMPFKKMQEK